MTLPLDELLELPPGVATGVVGLYVTPLASAATWNTEPFPYS